MSIEQEIIEFKSWLSAWFQPNTGEDFSKSAQDILKRLTSNLELRDAWLEAKESASAIKPKIEMPDIGFDMKSSLTGHEGALTDFLIKANKELSAKQRQLDLYRKEIKAIANKHYNLELNYNRLRNNFRTLANCYSLLSDSYEYSQTANTKEVEKLRNDIQGLELENRILKSKLYMAKVTNKYKGNKLYVGKTEGRFILGFGEDGGQYNVIATDDNFKVIMDMASSVHHFFYQALGLYISLHLSSDCITFPDSANIPNQSVNS